LEAFVVDDAEVTRLRLALSRIARQIDRQVSNDGMPRTQLSVLGTVASRKQIGVGELADTEGVNPTMLSRIVGRLESAGLVIRSPSDEDRRVIVVRITTEGAALHRRLRRERTALIADGLADLPHEEVDALMALVPTLETLAASLRSKASA
jgi:DNA-binding MarR family transcriptional regulator